MINLPFWSSRNQTWTMDFECLRWWMSHRDKVWILCCVLFNSDNFFTKLLSEKDDMFSPSLRFLSLKLTMKTIQVSNRKEGVLFRILFICLDVASLFQWVRLLFFRCLFSAAFVMFTAVIFIDIRTSTNLYLHAYIWTNTPKSVKD